MKQSVKCFFGFHQNPEVLERRELVRRGTKVQIGVWLLKRCKHCGTTWSESHMI